jgi:TPR repeat protein
MAFPTAAAHAAASIPEFSDEKENGYVEVAMLRKEAEDEDLDAMRKLARKFLLGIGIEQDQEEGIYWLRQLSNHRDPFAPLVLRGLIYLNYAEKKAHKILAEGLFLRAADKGSTLALHFLAGMYSIGDGVTRSRKKAIAFYQQAIELGDNQARVSLERLLKYSNSSNLLF